jgi:hypothetical protein
MRACPAGDGGAHRLRMSTAATLAALRESVRTPARGRHARWDDDVFHRWCGWQADFLWSALERAPAEARERSLLSYLDLVAAGIGAGYLVGSEGPPATLLEGFLKHLPQWLSATEPLRHAQIVADTWNLAQGARREALWIEQYLLARLPELDDPLRLPAQVLALLRPALDPQPDAVWSGSYEVSQIDLAAAAPTFLPGQISLLTPSLVRIKDRRQDLAVGVLLSRQGRSACIGRMEGAHEKAAVRPPQLPVSWGHDHVQVGGTRVPLPLLACEPLHTLALASGHLLAVVASSQRLWLVQPR